MKEYWLDAEDQFYVKKVSGGFDSVYGEHVMIPGWEEADIFVFYRPGLGFACAFGELGLILAGPKSNIDPDAATPLDYFPTQKDAIDNVVEHLSKIARKEYSARIHDLIERFGLSPRYRWEEMKDIS